MQKKYITFSLLSLSLLISPNYLFSQVNTNDQMEQASQELEGLMNEDFDDLDTTRSGAMDKDYDAICDQTPIKVASKWQQWVSSVGGTIMLRTVLFKRFITAQCATLKNNMIVWWCSKPKKTFLKNGC